MNKNNIKMKNHFGEEISYNKIFKHNLYKYDEGKLPVINTDNLDSYNHRNNIPGKYQNETKVRQRKKVEGVKVKQTVMNVKMDDMKEFEKELQLKHDILFENAKTGKQFLTRIENREKLKATLLPKKLYKDSQYLQQFVINKEVPKVEKKKLDTGILYHDLLDYNHFVENVGSKLVKYFPQEKMLGNVINLEENFYQNVYEKIKENKKKVGLNALDSIISIIPINKDRERDSFISDEKKTSYIFTEGNNTSDKDFSESKLILKDANLKIIKKKKNKLEYLNELHEQSGESSVSFSDEESKVKSCLIDSLCENTEADVNKYLPSKKGKLKLNLHKYHVNNPYSRIFGRKEKTENSKFKDLALFHTVSFNKLEI